MAGLHLRAARRGDDDGTEDDDDKTTTGVDDSATTSVAQVIAPAPTKTWGPRPDHPGPPTAAAASSTTSTVSDSGDKHSSKDDPKWYPGGHHHSPPGSTFETSTTNSNSPWLGQSTSSSSIVEPPQPTPSTPGAIDEDASSMPGQHKRVAPGMVGGAVVGAGLLLLAGVVFLVWWLRRRRRDGNRQYHGTLPAAQSFSRKKGFYDAPTSVAAVPQPQPWPTGSDTAHPLPVILAPINGNYMTGLDNSDMLSMSSGNTRAGLGDPFADRNSISSAAPPPYTAPPSYATSPRTTAPGSIGGTSRNSSLRTPFDPFSEKNASLYASSIVNPFNDPVDADDDAVSAVSAMSSSALNRDWDTRSSVSDISPPDLRNDR